MRERCCIAAFRLFPEPHAAVTLSRRFETIAHAFESHTAIEERGARASYGELNAQANSIASALLDRRGENPEAVGVLLAPGRNAIAAMLGVCKAGKYFVPLDPSYPAARNRFVLEDSDARICIVQAAAAVTEGLAVIDLSMPLPMQSSDLPSLAGPESIAYVFYTSGSTGQPKGVIQSHRNSLHFLMNYINGLHICSEDRLSMLYSMGNSAMLMDTFAALLTGATLLPFPLAAEGPVHLRDWLISSKVSVYHSVASVFRALASTVHDQRFPHVRVVDFGGEPVLRSDFEIWRRLFEDHSVFVNGFGVTELNVIRQFFADKDTRIEQARVPVGYPVPGTAVVIEDDEIIVESPFLSEGYLNRPGLTASAFGTNSSGMRCFRTGDRGCLDQEGCLTHRGRKDFQIKVAGNRVEPAEIEVALRERAGVTDAVAGLYEFAPGDARLVAWCVPGTGRLPSDAEMRENLSGVLPRHMIPAAFVELDQLPRTENGKVDRKSLPAPATRGSALFDLATATVSERTMWSLWEECLGAPPAGPDQSFFDAGGSSLLAARLVGRVEQVFRKAPPTALLFRIPTVRQMARILDGNQTAPHVFALQPFGSRPPFLMLGAWPYSSLLATMLPADQPLFGLNMERHEMLRTGRPIRLDRICRELARRILEFQPRGPFWLGGYSLWGVYAYEVAAQLEQQGHRVKAVVLIDSHCRAEVRSLSRAGKMTARLLWSLLPWTPEHEQLRTLRWAAEWTRPSTLHAPVYLFAAAESATKLPVPGPPRLGTLRAFGELYVRTVPGGHFTMMEEPHLSVLGQEIDKCLRVGQMA